MTTMHGSMIMTKGVMEISGVRKKVSKFFLFVSLGVAILLADGGSIKGLYPSSGGVNFPYIITCFLIYIIFAVNIIIRRSSRFIISGTTVGRYILAALFCMLIPTFINGYFYYGQSLFTGVRECIYHAGIVFPFVLISFFPKMSHEYITKLFLLLATYCTIMMIFYVVSPSLTYVIWDKDALTKMQDTGRENRFALPQGFRFTFYYAYYYFLAKLLLEKGAKQFNRSVLKVVGIILLVLFVLIDRRRMLGMFLVTVPAVLFMLKLSKVKSLIISVLAILALGILFFAGPVLFNHIDHLINKTEGEYVEGHGSTGIRVRSAEFYWNEFKKTNYVGIGAISPLRVTKNFEVVNALDRGLNHVDIGYLGVLCMWGVQGLLVTVFLVFYSFKVFRKTKNFVSQKDKIIILAGTMFLSHEFITSSQFFWSYKNSLFWGLFFFQVLLIDLRYRKIRIV